MADRSRALRRAAAVTGALVLSVVLPVFLAADVGTIRDDLARGRYGRAESAARALLHRIESSEGPEARSAADCLDVLVEAIRLNGTFRGKDARSLGERAIALRERLPGSSDAEIADGWLRFGDLLFARAEYGDAERAYLRALAIRLREEPIDPVGVAAVRSRLGRVLWAWQSRHAEAGALLRAAAETLEAELGPEDRRYGAVLAMLGDQQRQSEAFEDAERTLTLALGILERSLGARHPEVAATRMVLARAVYRRGRREEALRLQSMALRDLETSLGTEHPLYGLSLARWALSAWVVQSRFDEAHHSLDRAVRILEDSAGPDHPWLAIALNNRGNCAKLLGDLRIAREDLERALIIRTNALGPDHAYTAMSLNNLGLFYYDTLDFERAEELFQDARRAWERSCGRDSVFAQGVQVNIGSARMALGDPAGAETWLRAGAEGLATALGDENHPFVAEGLTALGRCEHRLGKDQEAVRTLERALRILDASADPDPYQRSATAEALGVVLEADPESRSRARALHEQVLSYRMDVLGERHPDVARSLLALARLAALDDRPREATRLALEAEDIRREHLLLTARLASERDALRGSIRETAALDLALSLTPESGDDVARAWDRVVRTRALVFDELSWRQRELHGVREPEVDRRLRELGALRSRLAHLMLVGSTEGRIGDFRARVEDLRSRKEALERDLAKISAEFRADTQRKRVGLEDVLAHLPGETALVAYVRYSRFDARSGASMPAYLALVVRSPDAEPVRIPLGDAVDVEREIEAWIDALTTPPPALIVPARRAERECDAAGETVRRRIWDPVERLLPPGGDVLVVPDGVLHRVTFAAMPAPAGDGFLLEGDRTVDVISAERDLASSPRERLGEGLLVVGDPGFGSPSPGDGSIPASRARSNGSCDDPAGLRFEPLPGTRLEVEAVVSMWRRCSGRSTDRCPGGAEAWTGEAARERRIAEAVAGRRVVHFATHGFHHGVDCARPADDSGVGGSGEDRPVTVLSARTNPMILSGLALAGANRREHASGPDDDGILTAAEVASLDLRGVEWVVLSGCDTGRGDVLPGEGVLGFRRAFRAAGARAVIMSLWPVSDHAAVDWMRGLYAARAQERSTAGAARSASLGVLHARRAAGQSTHPYFWAPFVAEGNGR